MIAYGAGGSLETIRGYGEEPTGIYFGEQTVESLMDGILRFETTMGMFRPALIQRWAAKFSTEVFLRKMRRFVLEVMPAAAEAMAPETVVEVL